MCPIFVLILNKMNWEKSVEVICNALCDHDLEHFVTLKSQASVYFVGFYYERTDF